jgi:class 3 adenylate cyclase
VRSVPEAERRQLTVMFCDLVGSTDLSGTLDPEDLREVVRAYQEAAAEVVKRYEGHIAQYLGDGLLIYFGFPVAHEDDIQRAVHTGLGIVDVMITLNTQLETNYGVQLAVRIGIHMGSVVIGEMGGGDRHEQLALGETPNIAARLEGLTAPNTIVMSEVVHRMVQGYFVCRDLGDHQLKGVSKPLRIYQVLQPSGAQSRLGAAVHLGLSPFSGREVEYRTLEALWMRVCQGQGQFCFVLGNAGIGKSRLIYEFTQTLDSISICTVQASNSGQALLYYPF